MEQISGLFQRLLHEEAIEYGFDYLDAYRSAANSGIHRATYPTKCGRLSIVYATANRGVIQSSHSNSLSLSSGVDTNGVLSSCIYTRDYEGNKFDLDFNGPQFYDSFMEWLSAVINTMSSVRTEIIEKFERTRDLQYAAEVCTFSRLAAKYGFNNVQITIYHPKDPEVDPWGNMELNIFKSD